MIEKDHLSEWSPDKGCHSVSDSRFDNLDSDDGFHTETSVTNHSPAQAANTQIYFDHGILINAVQMKKWVTRNIAYQVVSF